MESRSRRAGPSRSLPASGGEWTFGPLLARPDGRGENAFCGQGSVRAQRTFAFSSFRLLLSDRRLLCVRHAHFGGQLFDEGEPSLRQFVGGGCEVAPDGGGSGQLALGLRKRFDGQPAVVTDVFEGLEYSAPVAVARAGNSAVVFGNVDVAELIRDRTQRCGGVLLFNVRVKRVEMDSNVASADFSDQPCRVFERVEEISLKAVQRFKAQGDAELLRVAGDPGEPFGRALPFFPRAPVSAHESKRGVERPAEEPPAELGRLRDAFLKVLDSAGPHFWLRADQVGLTRKDGARRPLEAGAVEDGPELGHTGGLVGRNKKLHAVEPPAPDPAKERLVLLSQPCCPHQHVDAIFHVGLLPAGRKSSPKDLQAFASFASSLDNPSNPFAATG